MVNAQGLFEAVEEFPDDRAAERYAGLIGIDHIKSQALAEGRALLAPEFLAAWSKKAHKTVLSAVADVMDRTPLIVMAGDVGTGKTELAETMGDQLARELNVPVALFPLSLSARGHGAVGEMTTLLSASFDVVREHAAGGRARDGRLRHAAILLIDEADALAQSRELAQMHHEDRAGVNALIRGLNSLRVQRLPVLTIMCTNRVEALDPAILRRAAAILEFARPDDDARRALLAKAFDGVDFKLDDLEQIVALTGRTKRRPYGWTFSDLRQRLVPTAVLTASASGTPITGQLLRDLAVSLEPTRPFDAELTRSHE